MAIWNNTYIHGILDTDDGYYLTPYHYSVASYNGYKNAIVLGDSRINTIIHGPLNITDDANEYSTIIAKNGDISARGNISITGNISCNKNIYAEDIYAEGNIYTGEDISAEGNISAYSVISKSYSDGFKINDYNVASMPLSATQIVLGDSRINTIIHGALNITDDANEYSTTIAKNGDISTKGNISAEEDISAYGVISKSNNDGFKINDYNVASIPPRSTLQIQIADEDLNTVIYGHNISLANNTTIDGRLTSYGLILKNDLNNSYFSYGTGDPPINAIEGQIYFKIVS